MNREIALFAELYPLLHQKNAPAATEADIIIDTAILPQNQEDENQLALIYEGDALRVQTL